mmetsp:Transcript_111926/g.316306  ORF Transcript_111926/g.316306 Transcript_111926/m.316306 type:complete len:266 (-) Transcript_111926:368-1165(-)
MQLEQCGKGLLRRKVARSTENDEGVMVFLVDLQQHHRDMAVLQDILQRSLLNNLQHNPPVLRRAPPNAGRLIPQLVAIVSPTSMFSLITLVPTKTSLAAAPPVFAQRPLEIIGRHRRADYVPLTLGNVVVGYERVAHTLPSFVRALVHVDEDVSRATDDPKIHTDVLLSIVHVRVRAQHLETLRNSFRPAARRIPVPVGVNPREAQVIAQAQRHQMGALWTVGLEKTQQPSLVLARAALQGVQLGVWKNEAILGDSNSSPFQGGN